VRQEFAGVSALAESSASRPDGRRFEGQRQHRLIFFGCTGIEGFAGIEQAAIGRIDSGLRSLAHQLDLGRQVSLLCSRSILNVITEAWMRVQDRPTFRAGVSVSFDDFIAAAEGK
jgi:hypothetical protein